MIAFSSRIRWAKPVSLVVCLLYSLAQAADKEIDLTKIEHFPHKGRVQDQEGGEPQPIINALHNRKIDAIPLLIEMLDDESFVTNQAICYLARHPVGDVARVILTDFFTDATWTNSTLPGSSWNEMLESKPDPNRVIPTYYQLTDFKQEHGNKRIKQKWQQLWARYRDEIVWDDRERCFRLKLGNQ